MHVRAWLVLFVVLTAAPALALDDPEQMVRGLYHLKNAPIAAAQLDRLFARDLTRAITKDGKSKDEVGALDFDYRYGAQEWKIRGLKVATTAKELAGAEIEVRFRNFGKPNTVTYRMCLAKRGWRIADISGRSAEDKWSLRDLLKLTKQKIDC